jgi:adenylate cyclase
MAAAEQALSLDPDLAEAHSIKGRLLIHLGRTAEASSEIETALRLDPESYEVNINAGYACFSQRRFEDACRHYEAATALVDTALHAPTMLISCFAAIGDAAGLERAAREVVARAERAVAQDQGNGSAMASGASALAALGESERARNWTARC